MRRPEMKIDDESYVAGRVAFNSGKTVRQLVEETDARMRAIKDAAPERPSPQEMDKVTDELETAEEKIFSLGLGFVDAMFDRLRSITR